jgi:uncharacterized protein YcbX
MTGRVSDVFRWPAKGFGGERPDSIALTPHGVAGDRIRMLRSNGKKVAALGVPRLLLWRATSSGTRDPAGREWSWEDPGLPAALGEDLRRPIAIEDHPDGRPDVPGTVLVTVEASRVAMEDALGAQLDIRRFRPNLHLALAVPAWAEEEWVGRRLRVGGAELVGDHLCDRCAVITRDPDTSEKWGEVLRWVNDRRDSFFGVRCRVTKPGTVRAGDPVSVV